MRKPSFAHYDLRRITEQPSSPIPKDWITEECQKLIASGIVPDVRLICLSLHSLFGKVGEPKSVTDAIPVLHKLDEWPNTTWSKLTQGKIDKCLLIDNEIFKALLITWPKSEISSIHGHPKGGGVFKLLKGSIEELRYTSDESPKLLSVSTYQQGSVGFINDDMGYHAVGNPFDTPAVSIHVYKHN